MVTKFQSACHPLRRTPFSVQEFTEHVPAGIALEDVLSVDYWIDVIHSLRLDDLITVIATDGSYDVSLRVVRLGNDSIEFRILREWRPEIDDVATPMLMDRAFVTQCACAREDGMDVMADEVQKKIPDAVAEVQPGIRGVNYDRVAEVLAA